MPNLFGYSLTWSSSIEGISSLSHIFPLVSRPETPLGRTKAEKTLSTSAFFFLYVLSLCPLIHSAVGSHFPDIPSASDKPVVHLSHHPSISLARFNSKWALAFLILSLWILRQCLHPSRWSPAPASTPFYFLHVFNIFIINMYNGMKTNDFIYNCVCV